MLENAAIRLEEIYRGLQRAHGTFRITGSDPAKKGKKVGRALTVFEPTDVTTWMMHLKGDTGLGIVPINEDDKCRWGAIDVDVYNTGVVEELEEKCRKLQLPAVVIRTKSGGAHITCYVSDELDARMMRAKMQEIAAALGVAGVEIYPKQVALAGEKDSGNWLNMPYFEGDATERYAVYKGRGLTVMEFLDLVSVVRISSADFMALSFAGGEHFSDGPPCLQTMAVQGITPGCRNEALFAMGVYARMKWESNWEDKVDDLNQLIVHPPLSSREVQGVCKSLARKTYFYTCSKAPLIGFCNKELCKKREYGIGTGGEPTIDMGGLVKICTDPPSWIIDIEGVRFELDTEDLMSQAKFAKVCVEKINKWPAPVKPPVWQKLIQDRLDNAENVPAPEEASPEGRFFWHLEQFCVVTAPARVREELLLGKPWTEEGRHYFRSEDLMRYLNHHHFKDVTPRKAWSLLRNKLGATHKQLQLKGRCVQTWSVPEYAKQIEQFEKLATEVDF